MQYELNGNNTSAKEFARMTATMNPVAVAQIFEVTCHDIFEYLFATGYKDGGLLGPISTYFDIMKTNGRGMLHLHYVVCLHSVFHVTQQPEQLEANSEYTAHIVEFINRIIRCSIIPEDEAHGP